MPPGSYRLRTWHADLLVGSPALDQPLTVAATGTQAIVKMTGAGP